MVRILLINLINILLVYNSHAANFYELMGEKEGVWKHVLNEDHAILGQLSQAFEQKLLLKSTKDSIPKKIHFIWIGPKEFPQSSIKNVYSWAEKHPEYQIYFWTDRERSLPHLSMQIRFIHDFSWQFLEEEFLASDNYAERSDLLRYEILYQEGGVYVDHDVECFQPLTSMVKTYDLFCGLEFPHKPIGDTSITVCNNLIGSCPHHPILKRTIDNIVKNWQGYTQLYIGSDGDSVTRRVYYRTFSPFDKAVKFLLDMPNYTTMVYPAGYFNKLDKKFGLYTHHSYAGTWFENETSFEKNVRHKLIKICKKNNQILLLAAVCFLTLLFLILGMFIQIRSMKKELSTLKRS